MSNFKWKMGQIFLTFSDYPNFFWTACTFIGRNQTSFCTIWIKKAGTARFDSTNINTWYQRYKLPSTPQSTNSYLWKLTKKPQKFEKNLPVCLTLWKYVLSKKWDFFFQILGLFHNIWTFLSTNLCIIVCT